MSDDEEIELEHHKQKELCTTRPPYRQGRKLTAIKTYTINNESVYLLIFGVPKINLRKELKTQCEKYGALASLTLTAGYKTEQFTECFLAKFDRIQSARTAKRKLDTRNYFGGLLHVCYAPEMESVEETRHKLDQRRFEVNRQLIKYELSKQSVVDILKHDTKLSRVSSEVGNADNTHNLPLINSRTQDTNNIHSSASISLFYSSNCPNVPLKPVAEISRLQIEFIPDSLPTVNISNDSKILPRLLDNSRTASRWSNNGNSTVVSNGELNSRNVGMNKRFKGVSEAYIQNNLNFKCSTSNSNINTLCYKDTTSNRGDVDCESSRNIEKVIVDKKEYVFKRKRKKKLKKVKELSKIGSDFLNSVEILKDTTEKDGPAADATEDFGKVTVCNAFAEPRIVKLPQKPVNKIVFNIKNDKLL